MNNTRRIRRLRHLSKHDGRHVTDPNGLTVAKWRWVAGVAPNPKGRPPMPEELKILKSGALAQAVKILAACVNDPKYLESLRPDQLQDLLSAAFDRFGLPKVVRQELTGKDGDALKTEQSINLSNISAETLEKLANGLDSQK